MEHMLARDIVCGSQVGTAEESSCSRVTNMTCLLRIIVLLLLLIAGIEVNPGPPSNASRDDLILKKLTSLECLPKEMKNINGKLDQILNRLEQVEEASSRLEQEAVLMREKIERLEVKNDYLENQSRRNNLVFIGVDEKSSETWDECKSVLIETVRRETGVVLDEMDIERAHRIGSGNKKPRPLIAKFLHFKKREDVLQSRRSIKGGKLFIREDFSARVLEERRKLMPRLKEAKDSGQKAFLTFNKLKIGRAVYGYDWSTDTVVLEREGLPQREEDGPRYVTRSQRTD